MPAERLQIRFDRAIPGLEEDMLVCTQHFTSTGGGLLDTPTRTGVVDAWEDFWGYYKGTQLTSIKLVEFRFYEQNVYPTLSPLLEVFTITAVPGSQASGAMPAQLSVSVTEETDYRKRWGRFYLPGPHGLSYTSSTGRLSSTFVDQTATAAETMYNAFFDAGAVPVVWSPKGGAGPPAFAAGSTLPVKRVRVDDIPDIIRSRRHQDNPLRHMRPVGP